MKQRTLKPCYLLEEVPSDGVTFQSCSRNLRKGSKFAVHRELSSAEIHLLHFPCFSFLTFVRTVRNSSFFANLTH